MRKLTTALAALVLLAAPAAAQMGGIHVRMDSVVVTDSVPPEWTFIGYSFTRATSSNVAPRNEILQGQVIGRLFGRNSTETGDFAANYVEQRYVPYLIYRPKILDGLATFRTMFKIDYTWGDQAYGVGGNRGGAINVGQVNLQTLMANVDLAPAGAGWNAVIGMQRLYDHWLDPHDITLETALTSGYKLAFWGTNALGVNVFGSIRPGVQGRIGAYQLWENFIARDDDVVLFMGDVTSRVTPRLELGADLWYLRDRAEGAGGISILGQGLNSPLAEYNGAARLGIASSYHADIAWIGGRAAYNRDFLAGRWWADAFAIANVGVVDTLAAGVFEKGAGVLGLAANASLAYKHGMTAGDKAWLELLFTTGDGDGARDGSFNSVITGNAWGSPVGIYSAHRAFLLFPDPQVVSRYYSAVHDISNMGFGVTGGSFNVARDWIPNRLNTKVGVAAALSNTTPVGGGHYMGTEVNFEAKYELGVFLTAGLNAAYLKLGDFYDAPGVTQADLAGRPDDPWTVFLTLSWLMF
ncbi:MAG: hypothetical protein ACLFRX_10425 [Gemmatimonadota bacterium]